MDGGNANPFFRSLNQSYGEPWMSSNGVNPLHLKDTPEYKDLVRNSTQFLSFCIFLGRERNCIEKFIENIQT